MRLAHDGGALLLLLADVQQPDHRVGAGRGRRACRRCRGRRSRPAPGRSSRRWRRRRARAPARRRWETAWRRWRARRRRAGRAGRWRRRGSRRCCRRRRTRRTAPAFCRPRPTTTLDLGFFRTAASGFSPMPMTSAASWISRRLRSTSGWRGELGLDDLGAADQLNHEARPAGSRGPAAPRRSRPAGALSPPIASTRDANHAQASSTSICFLPR